jgi:hypothetical protein
MQSDRRCSNATPTRRAPSSPHAKLTPANHTRLSQARCACKADNVRAGQTLCQDEARAGQCMQHAGSSSTLKITSSIMKCDVHQNYSRPDFPFHECTCACVRVARQIEGRSPVVRATRLLCFTAPQAEHRLGFRQRRS